MKRLLLFQILCLTTIITHSQISGYITEDVTWSGIVSITGDVWVRNGVTLTIDPGTQVLFQTHDYLYIQGTIRAHGTRDKMIVFSPADSAGWSDFSDTTGGWGGIHFPNVNLEQSVLTNCVFMFAKGWEGGAVQVMYRDNVVIDSCIFFMNYATSSGGALDCSGTDITISNTIFQGNITPGNGGAILINGGNPHINACLFSNNKANVGGVLKTQHSRALLTNNIMVNNEAVAGGAVFLTTDSNLKFINNTICMNKSSEGGGIIMMNQCYPVFINNILHGNVDDDGLNQIEMSSITPGPELISNNIQGGFSGLGFMPGASFTGTYKDNIDTLPDFEEATTMAGLDEDGSSKNWKLNMTSPCINAGLNIIENISNPTDYDGNQRIRYAYTDLGAREYYNPAFELPGTIASNLNITADTIYVSENVRINDGVTLGISPGTIIEFQEYLSFDVRGTILAMGSKTDNIVFTVKDTLGFSDINSNSGGWGGIRFESIDATNDSSKFIHCRFEYGKAMVGNDNSGGAIYIEDFNKVLVEHCYFENNMANTGGAIRTWSSPITIKHSVFRNNYASHSGGAISCLLSNVLIDKCLFEYNISTYGGGGVSLSGGRSAVINCTFRHNSSMNGGGLESSDSYPDISGNTFINNSAESKGGGINLQNSAYISKNFVANNISGDYGGGMACRFQDDADITNNIVVNNSALRGGGIYMQGMEPGFVTEFVNNTVANNYAEYTGGGVQMSQIDTRYINSILWGNRKGTRNSQLYFDSQSGPGLIFCNIEGGKDSIEALSSGEIIQYEFNIDSFPEFMEPSSGPGSGFDGIPRRWDLKSTSPCINSGTHLTGDLEIPATDIFGKSRINYEQIDIGAAENQGTDPFVSLHPFSQYQCEGNKIEFRAMASDSVHFQWQLDGVDIPGAVSNRLVIDSIILSHQGAYTCRMRNAYGQIESNPALLITILPPTIWKQPVSRWVRKGDLTELDFGYEGTEPLNFVWYKNGDTIKGVNYPELRFQNTSYADEGIYSCTVSNSCGTAETEEITLYIAPEICMVTVDLATGNNLVVWEKPSEIAPIAQYNLYRESVSAGIFDPIGTVPSDDLSIFLDSVANPTNQSYQYKITATDTSGRETDIELCRQHKTIHLLTTTNPETRATQLDWDYYFGFDYGTFNIYRSSTESNFSQFHQMASSSTTYTDDNPDQALYYYRIGVVKPEPCFPSSTAKADTDPYSHSMSNVEDNRLQSTDLEKMAEVEGLIIYPNPFSDHATLYFPNPENSPYVMRITDLSGKVIISEQLSGNEYILNRGNMEIGYYIIELSGERLFRTKIIIE